MMKLINKMKIEKLNIHIEYDEEVGLSLKEFNDYLNGLNESYVDFTNKKSHLLV